MASVEVILVAFAVVKDPKMVVIGHRHFARVVGQR